MGENQMGVLEIEKGSSDLKKEKSCWKQIIVIALPIIVQGLVFQLQSLTDKAFLGNVDTLFISAIGAAQFPFNTTLDGFVALSTGVVILVSQLVGAHDMQRMKQYVKSTLFYNSLLSVLLFILWFVFPEQILGLLKVDERILAYSVQYVRVCSFYFLFAGLDSGLQAMLQGMGETKPIMYSGVIKVVLNIIFSWILIFGHFGFPKLDILGAAIGTVVANIFSAILIILYCMVIKKEVYGLHKDNSLWFKRESYKRVIQLGIPTGLEYIMWNASNLVLIRFLNQMSYKAMAIYTLTFGIEVVVYAVFSGLAKSSMTLIGQSIGAQGYKQAHSVFKNCLKLDVIVVAVAFLGFAVFNKPILGIFSKETELVTATVPYLMMAAVTMFPKSLNVVIGNAIRAYGDTRWMLYSQIVGSILVVSCGYLLCALHLGILAIYVTLLLDECIRASLNYWHYKRKCCRDGH